MGNPGMIEHEVQWRVPGSEFLISKSELIAKSAIASSIGINLLLPGPGLGTEFAQPTENDNENVCIQQDYESETAFDIASSRILPGVELVEQLARQLTIEGQKISNHLAAMLKNARMPASWMEEGIENPTSDCRYFTLNLLSRLSTEFGIIPYKVAFSKEGGLFAAYRSDNGNVLRIEVDNELDAVAVVSDGIEILDSGLLEADDLERGILNAFKGNAFVASEM